MTMEEVNDHLEYFFKFEADKHTARIRDWIVTDRKQDLSWIAKNRIGKVIRKHG